MLPFSFHNSGVRRNYIDSSTATDQSSMFTTQHTSGLFFNNQQQHLLPDKSRIQLAEASMNVSANNAQELVVSSWLQNSAATATIQRTFSPNSSRQHHGVYIPNVNPLSPLAASTAGLNYHNIVHSSRRLMPSIAPINTAPVSTQHCGIPLLPDHLRVSPAARCIAQQHFSTTHVNKYYSNHVLEHGTYIVAAQTPDTASNNSAYNFRNNLFDGKGRRAISSSMSSAHGSNSHVVGSSSYYLSPKVPPVTGMNFLSKSFSPISTRPAVTAGVLCDGVKSTQMVDDTRPVRHGVNYGGTQTEQKIICIAPSALQMASMMRVAVSPLAKPTGITSSSGLNSTGSSNIPTTTGSQPKAVNRYSVRPCMAPLRKKSRILERTSQPSGVTETCGLPRYERNREGTGNHIPYFSHQQLPSSSSVKPLDKQRISFSNQCRNNNAQFLNRFQQNRHQFVPNSDHHVKHRKIVSDAAVAPVVPWRRDPEKLLSDFLEQIGMK